MPTLQELSSMFDSGNYGLLDRGLQAQATGQQRQEADLASVLQKTQQDAAMHPLEMQYKQASTGNLNAQARNSDALAAQHEDALSVLKTVPTQQRVDDWTATALKNKSGAQLDELKAHMGAAAQIAAKAISNGGQLPLAEQTKYAQTHPELLEYLKMPNGAQTLANIVTKYESLQGDRLKSDSAHTIAADATKYAADKGAASRVTVAEAAATAAAERLKAKVSLENDPLKKQTALKMEANLAEAGGDLSRAELLRAWASSLDPQVAAKTGLIAKPGAIDLSKQTQGGVATTPGYEGIPAAGQAKPGNVVTPKTKAEYDAIPKGTTYVDTDGIKKIKG
jgi:hypothetical protein